MKTYLLAALLIILLNSNNLHQPIPHTLLVESTFYPAFQFPVQIKIAKTADSGYVTFTVLDKRNIKTIITKDSVLLSPEDFLSFLVHSVISHS